MSASPHPAVFASYYMVAGWLTHTSSSEHCSLGLPIALDLLRVTLRCSTAVVSAKTQAAVSGVECGSLEHFFLGQCWTSTVLLGSCPHRDSADSPSWPVQDVLVVTAPGSGAEVIPFLKTYVNLPMAIGFSIMYAKVPAPRNPVLPGLWLCISVSESYLRAQADLLPGFVLSWHLDQAG